MKRSLIPGFIKRRSISHGKETEDREVTKEGDNQSTTHGEDIKLLREKFVLGLERKSSDVKNSGTENVLKSKVDDDWSSRKRQQRYSLTDEIINAKDANFIVSNLVIFNTELEEAQMVEQEDIIALTGHVRCFSDALNNLRNTFKESFADGVYNSHDCRTQSHSRLGEVLTLLKDVLDKYPLLQSSEILIAATNIIEKIKTYNYSDGGDGPTDFYAAIDQLALSFSGSVSDFLMGDKEMTLPNSVELQPDQFDDSYLDAEDDFDGAYEEEESEDSLDKITTEEDFLMPVNHHHHHRHQGSSGFDQSGTSPNLSIDPDIRVKSDSSIQRTDELDRALLNIEDSVEIALKRTKVWAKYSKDILSYIERRSHLELEFCKQAAKLSVQTRTSIMEESYLPFQSIYVTALDNDIQFSNNYQKSCQSQLEKIIEKLKDRQKDHDTKRSKIKTKWKNELKKVAESRENLRTAKKSYVQKQKDLEKYYKQQQEGKDDKPFSIGKKKHEDDFIKSAEESEEHYKQCVEEANIRQHEIQRVKADMLFDLRQLIYQCDLTMKAITISYFQMMQMLLTPLPVQYRTLVESSNLYEEGQQFADFVRLQQSTCNQAMIPTYHFEKFKGEAFRNASRHGTDALSSEDFIPTFFPTTPKALHRRHSINSAESERPTSPNLKKTKNTWGSGRNKGSATDDTDSISSRSLPASPHTSPTARRKDNFKMVEVLSDDEKEDLLKKTLPGPFRNQKHSAAAKMHQFRKLRAPSKCKECESYAYFNGAECEKCGLICHKKCLENLAIKCGNKRLPRKMTTFGVDIYQHLAATKREDIPYIIEKCIEEIDENGLSVKGLYRVSGVKSKVEKLCQQFEAGGDLVDLSTTSPHFVASVLKLYLRQLPEPLLTFAMYPSFIKLAKDSMNLKLGVTDLEHMNEQDCSQYEDIISQLHAIVKQLPSANYYTVATLIQHLRRVADNSEQNQMGAANLAIVFGPTLLRPEGDASSLASVMDMVHQTRAVELLILNTNIFAMIDNSSEKLITEYPDYLNKNNNIAGASKCTVVKKRSESPIASKHTRQASNLSVGAEFSQEVISMTSLMDSGNKYGKGNIPAAKEPTEKPVNGFKRSNDPDYDELGPDRESDILGDFPPADVTDKRDDLSDLKMSALEALLSSDPSLVSHSRYNNSNNVNDGEEDDDDLWMEKFGKSYQRARSLSNNETMSAFVDPFNMARSQNRKNSSFSRLETTTYSFSLGGNFTEEDQQKKAATDMVWVKRDGRERVPVRKLRSVNIKVSTDLSTPLLKNTPFTLNDSKTTSLSADVGKDASHAAEKPDVEIITTPSKVPAVVSPKNNGPLVMPKPIKKVLDKKTWTADLIRSKSQALPETPIPGSLNDKLLSRRRVGETRSSEDESEQLKNKSVKEILMKFQNTPSWNEEEENNLLTSEERYV